MKDLKLPVLVFTLMSLIYLPVPQAQAHSDVILGCSENIEYTQAKKISEYTNFGGGFVIEHYDTNADGYSDIMALSPLTPVGPPNDPMPAHRQLAWFYYVDRDGDRIFETIYEDKAAKTEGYFHKEYPCDMVVLFATRGDKNFVDDVREFWMQQMDKEL